MLFLRKINLVENMKKTIFFFIIIILVPTVSASMIDVSIPAILEAETTSFFINHTENGSIIKSKLEL